MRTLAARMQLLVALLLACGISAHGQTPSGGSAPPEGELKRAPDQAAASQTARAAFKTRSGENAGDAMLRQTHNGVLVKVDLRGIQPGIHAFHVHETGRCDAPDFKSSGGHFAPRGREHGFLDAKGPHAGDLPNVHVLAAGDVSFEFFAEDLRLTGGSDALLDGDGAALVMHKSADDYRTDPAGGGGDRILCAVVMR